MIKSFISDLIYRRTMHQLYGTRFKKVYIQIRACDKSSGGKKHKPHTYVSNPTYTPGYPLYCEGLT